MNCEKHNNLLKQLQFLYSSFNPISPNDNIIEAGKLWADISKTALGFGKQKEYYVSTGYYSSNISVNIGHLSRFSDLKILYINALTLEYLSDLLLFSENHGKECFTYIFSKYMSIITKKDFQHDDHNFFKWIYNRYREKTEYNYQQHLLEAIAGGVFITLHEWIHTEANLMLSALALFRSESFGRSVCDELNTEMVREIACDFTALAICAKYNFHSPLKCTENEFLKAAIISLFLSDLYSLFTQLLTLNSGSSGSSVSHSEKIMTTLNIRCNNLIAFLSISKNSDLFFGEHDIISTIDSVLSTIEIYLKTFGEFLQKDYQIERKKYDLLGDEEKENDSLCESDSIWIYYF